LESLVHQFLRLLRQNDVFSVFVKNRPQAAPEVWVNRYWRQAVDAVVREKRIADHVRAITFAMADGILPSNEGAGYVVRRIIRRAFRDGSALFREGAGAQYQRSFLCKLVPIVVDHYGSVYSELKRNCAAIEGTVRQEEELFGRTLSRGLELLSGLIRDLKLKGERTLPGRPAFDLYQSQGLPREVVQDELAAEGLHLDVVGYEEAEQAHRERSKGGKQAAVFEKGWFQEVKAKAKPTVFLGYEDCEAEGKIVAIVRDGQLFDIIEAGDSATIVLDRTPFYAESGGQVGDTGTMQLNTERRTPNTEPDFKVADTQKRDDIYLHEGKLAHGKLRVGDTVTARVDESRRNRIRFNHSATHLMHAALRKVLGDHVVQRGSEVAPDRLRFDFSHPKALSFEERQEIERLVNEQIQANTEVGTAVMAPEEAQKAGAMALFGEKYGDRVRVLSMGRSAGVPPAKTAAGTAALPFSMELCGGTHVARTGDIGYFRIVAEGSSAAGIRRIEAVTGHAAYDLAAEEARQLAQLHALTKAQPGKVMEKVESLVKEVKDLKSRAKKAGAASGALDAVRTKAETVDGVTIYVAEVADAEAPELLTIKEALGQDNAPSAILLGSRGSTTSCPTSRRASWWPSSVSEPTGSSWRRTTTAAPDRPR
jgi:alanyl-tRNA synthetase